MKLNTKRYEKLYKQCIRKVFKKIRFIVISAVVSTV